MRKNGSFFLINYLIKLLRLTTLMIEFTANSFAVNMQYKPLNNYQFDLIGLFTFFWLKHHATVTLVL